jgi:hypothetical protein
MYISTPARMLMQSPQRSAAGFLSDIKVYEEVPIEPVRWEYRVLTVDANERSLPDEERLKELGLEGWLLVGVLNQGHTGDVSLVHYYFVRQIVK